MKKSLEESIRAKRIHHQLMPMKIVFEKGFDPSIIEGLSKRRHRLVEILKSPIGFTGMTGVSRVRGNVEAMYDPRRDGSVAIE